MKLVQAVSLALVNQCGETLFVRRRAVEDEYPNCWSLPAKSFGPEESIFGTARAIGRRKLGTEVTDLAWVNMGLARRDRRRLRKILRPDIPVESVEEYFLLMHVVQGRLQGDLPEQLPGYEAYEWLKARTSFPPAEARRLYEAGKLGDCTRLYLEWLQEDSPADG
ncbi:MAG TPA: hypothetical protein EYP85_12360 [Armatimonadetes bacterium]|nr:hypothetical protein [Armatimonadota bacterium]